MHAGGAVSRVRPPRGASSSRRARVAASLAGTAAEACYQRQVLALVLFEGLRAREAAWVLGISVSAVTRTTRAALERLRQAALERMPRGRNAA